MCRVEQVGWTATEPSFSRTSRLGSSRWAQATESRISSSGWRSRRLLGEAVRAGAGVDHDRQLPLPAPAPERLGGAVGHQLRALGVALRRPRDRAAAARRRRPGSRPACRPGPRPPPSPPAEGGPAPSPLRRAEDPVDAGGHVDGRRALARGPRQLRRGRRRHVARPGRDQLVAEQRAGRTGGRRASAGRRPSRRGGPRERVFSTDDQCSATRAAWRCAFSVCSSARNPLISLPVSMPERAGDLAGAVGGAGLDAVVLVLLEQRALHRRALAAGGPSRGG